MLILRVLEDGYNNIFAFILTVFSIASSQESNFQPQASNHAGIEDFKLFWTPQIKISFFGSTIRLTSLKTTLDALDVLLN